MKRLLAFMIFGLCTLPAMAQGPWYAKGEFNGWTSANLMTQDPQNSIHWSTTVTDLFDNTTSDFKLATDDWSQSAPERNAKVTSNAAGQITFHMWDQQMWSDGWFPNNQRRVGYNDPLEYGWQVMGSFDGFTTGLDMVNQGNGLYRVTAPFNAGLYDFKFRQAGSWDGVNFAENFSNGPGNNLIGVVANGDVWQFDLDLPNGRFRAFPLSQHGDFNGDDNADAADYASWRKNNPSNAAKYTEWRSNYGRKPSWIVHGDFGSDVTLTDQGGNNFGTTLSGLTPGTSYDVHIFRNDAGAGAFPGSIGKFTADANGAIKLHYYNLDAPSWNDGWNPADTSRVGYDDPHQFGWEVIGSFDDWPDTGAGNPAYYMTDQGNGLYTGSFLMPTAGTYDFKFRKQSDWSISIGDNFGNSAANNSFTVAANGDRWNFELDLPHGKWRAYHPTAGLGSGEVPEPASAVLVVLGLAFLGLGRRRF